MIKDILDSNECVFPNTKQMEALKENFPSCFKADGSFDIERFKEYLSDKLTLCNEGYELKFLGKNYARLLAAYQINANLDGIDGIFEYIMNSDGIITHQDFVPNVSADGIPHSFHGYTLI